MGLISHHGIEPTATSHLCQRQLQRVGLLLQSCRLDGSNDPVRHHRRWPWPPASSRIPRRLAALVSHKLVKAIQLGSNIRLATDVFELFLHAMSALAHKRRQVAWTTRSGHPPQLKRVIPPLKCVYDQFCNILLLVGSKSGRNQPQQPTTGSGCRAACPPRAPVSSPQYSAATFPLTALQDRQWRLCATLKSRA